jgi:spore maturation protein CgeB
MRILLAGEWAYSVYEEALARALLRIGHQVVPFSWRRYYHRAFQPMSTAPGWWAAKLAYHFGLAPLVLRISDALVEAVRQSHPDMVFIYRGLLVPSGTIQAIRRVAPRTVIVGYNNDDPFSLDQPAWLWRHFLSALPKYDLALTFRNRNLAEFRAAGAPRVALLRGWFVPWVHRPLALSVTDHDRFDCDVAYIGHFENDGRLDLLRAVAAAGFRLRIFGANWHEVPHFAIPAGDQPIHPVIGDAYVKAIRGAKVALAFLSSRNRDTYTTRNFEIPASGGVMLSQFTPELATMYHEGVEAEFFRHQDEAIGKIRRLCDDAEARLRISSAGRRRVIADGHDVVSRASTLIDAVAPLVAARSVAAEGNP